MGILLADYIDLDDVDFYSTGVFMGMFEESIQEENGSITVENFMKMEELRGKIERYNRNKDKLYAHAYGKINLLMYQMGNRDLHTEEGCLGKIREIKNQTSEMRKTLVEKYIELWHNKDIEDFNKYNKQEWLTPEETEETEEELE